MAVIAFGCLLMLIANHEQRSFLYIPFCVGVVLVVLGMGIKVDAAKILGSIIGEFTK